ncbi:OLC1v1023040C1 [Oldenlandia corymbosa var. corymbosa]|uniref:OLC1v1023040C1 n=1 Tax=Oldenlandia corymbosa var. corymbosa TaxID=529605 RepID=A0AAV1BZ34_OLDCO|nr:OLC1v1023040C1 [Oldenlandia corymbosa var. corymbosa]
MAHQTLCGECSKQVVAEEEDRLTALPEALIGMILSRIPTKEAVRTSVLAKPWRTTWTGITAIHLTDEGLPSEDPRHSQSKRRFIEFANNVITKCNSPLLRSFDMKCSKAYERDSLREWTSSVLMRRELEKFHLGCRIVSGTFGIPGAIFTLQALEELKLQLPCRLLLPAVTTFLNLKTLFLSKVRMVNDDNLPELIFHLPALTDLGFLCCQWRNVEAIVIRAPKLLNFQMSWCRYARDGREVFTVGLVMVNLAECCNMDKFRWAGNLVETFLMPQVSTVSQALLDQVIESNDYYHTGEATANLLTRLRWVDRLEISLDVAQAMLLVGRLETLPSFQNLTSLKVESRFTSGKGTLLHLLWATPFLKFLDLHIQESLMWRPDAFDKLEESELPSCVIRTLERVHFTYRFQTRIWLNFMELFLRNARKLELLQLHAPALPLATKLDCRLRLNHAPKASRKNVAIHVVL